MYVSRKQGREELSDKEMSHFAMMSSGMVFGEVISEIVAALPPVDIELLLLLNSVLNPMIAHIKSL